MIRYSDRHCIGHYYKKEEEEEEEEGKPFLNDTIKGVNKMYSNHLNPGQVWYSNDPNMPGCQMVWFSKGGPKTRLKMSAKLSKIQTVHLIS